MSLASIGEGSMVYTVIYQELNGDIRAESVTGHPDKLSAWRQGQKCFKQRLVALIPGNHRVITKKDIS